LYVRGGPVANTDKHNIRYPGDRWAAALRKTELMRQEGYDIDMTKVVRLGLVKADGPVRIYRSRVPRSAAA
jgi:hypothetical protein